MTHNRYLVRSCYLLRHLHIPLICIVCLCFRVVSAQEISHHHVPEEQTQTDFDHCERGKYQQVTAKINVKRTKDFSYYEHDSVRIYVSHYFFRYFLGDEPPKKELFRAFENDYASLFTDRFLTGRMFLCELYEDCRPLVDDRYSDQQGDFGIPNLSDLFGYNGPTIQILNLRHMESLDTPTTRRFEVWATPFKDPDRWNHHAVFYLELTKEEADQNTDLKGFIRGARLTCFKFGYWLT